VKAFESVIEAERSLMGLMAVDHTIHAEVAQRLAPGDLLVGEHRALWGLMGELATDGERWDVGVLYTEVARRGSEAFGGAAYLMRITSNLGASESAGYYLRIVQRASHVRQLREALVAGVEGLDRDDDPTAIVAAVERSMMALSRPEVEAGWVPLDRHVARVLSSIEERDQAGTEILGLRTGLGDLDRRIGGLRRATLNILGARPAMGKSACMMQATLNIARTGVGVGIFSLEMSGESLAQRLASNVGKINGERFLSTLPSLPERRRLAEAADELTRLPVWIDDRAGLSIGELRMRARRLAQQQPSLGMIAIDYLQLASSPGSKGQNREQEISQVSRGLRQIAKELNIPVLALAQLSRGLESRPIKDRRPQNYDLRDSGQIEQDADVIMFLFREEVYDPTTAERNVAEIGVTKCRAGSLGTTKLRWTGEYQRFEALDGRDEAVPYAPKGQNWGGDEDF
jgi:replicative DNA helicase